MKTIGPCGGHDKLAQVKERLEKVEEAVTHFRWALPWPMSCCERASSLSR